MPTQNYSRTGFIVKFNPVTKCGFVKVDSEIYRDMLNYQFFNLKNDNRLDFSEGDLITFNHFYNSREGKLKTIINLLEKDNDYAFWSNFITNYYVLKNKNLAVSIMIDKFNYIDTILKDIHVMKKNEIFMAYFNDDYNSGDLLLKGVIDEYVNSIDFKKMVDEKLVVKYNYNINSKRYCGGDYIMYSYEIEYITSFDIKFDDYLDRINEKYCDTIISDCSDDVYVDYHPIVNQYIEQHKTEMAEHCQKMTNEIRTKLKYRYNPIEHSNCLFSTYKDEIVKQIQYVNRVCKKTVDYWLYDETILFFNSFEFDESIKNQNDLNVWINKIKNLHKNDINCMRIIEKNISTEFKRLRFF